MVKHEVGGQIYWLRVLSAGQMASLIDSGMDDMHGLIRMVALATVREDGSRVWSSEGEAAEAPWTTIKALADKAMIVNGLEGDEPGEG